MGGKEGRKEGTLEGIMTEVEDEVTLLNTEKQPEIISN